MTLPGTAEVWKCKAGSQDNYASCMGHEWRDTDQTEEMGDCRDASLSPMEDLPEVGPFSTLAAMLVWAILLIMPERAILTTD